MSWQSRRSQARLSHRLEVETPLLAEADRSRAGLSFHARQAASDAHGASRARSVVDLDGRAISWGCGDAQRAPFPRTRDHHHRLCRVEPSLITKAARRSAGVAGVDEVYSSQEWDWSRSWRAAYEHRARRHGGLSERAGEVQRTQTSRRRCERYSKKDVQQDGKSADEAAWS